MHHRWPIRRGGDWGERRDRGSLLFFTTPWGPARRPLLKEIGRDHDIGGKCQDLVNDMEITTDVKWCAIMIKPGRPGGPDWPAQCWVLALRQLGLTPPTDSRLTNKSFPFLPWFADKLTECPQKPQMSISISEQYIQYATLDKKTCNISQKGAIYSYIQHRERATNM